MQRKKKRIELIFIDKAKEVYTALNEAIAQEEEQGIKNSFNRQLLNSIHIQIEKYKLKFPRGEPLPKGLIPKNFVKKYGLKTVFHGKLTQGWRMLYSFKQGKQKDEVLCIIVLIDNHPKYNRTMKYNKG